MENTPPIIVDHFEVPVWGLKEYAIVAAGLYIIYRAFGKRR